VYFGRNCNFRCTDCYNINSFGKFHSKKETNKRRKAAVKHSLVNEALSDRLS
jgi:hypothetical protein